MYIDLFGNFESSIWTSTSDLNEGGRYKADIRSLEPNEYLLIVSLMVVGLIASDVTKKGEKKKSKMGKGRIHVIHCRGVFAAVATIGRKWCSLPKVAPPTLFCTLTSSQFKSNKNLGRNFQKLWSVIEIGFCWVIIALKAQSFKTCIEVLVEFPTEITSFGNP